MTRRLSLIGCACSTLLVAGISTISAATTQVTWEPSSQARIPEPRMPEYVLVRFHADWCAACATLKPTYAEAQKRLAQTPVLFVTLDITTKETKKQAEFMAASLDLDAAWITSGLKTGQMLLVDSKTHEVVLTFKSDEKIDRVIECITACIGRR